MLLSPLRNPWAQLVFLLNAQEERLATSPLLVTRLHLPHAIVIRLHVYKDNVVIFTPDPAGTVGVSAIARSAPQGADVIYLLP